MMFKWWVDYRIMYCSYLTAEEKHFSNECFEVCHQSTAKNEVVATDQNKSHRLSNILIYITAKKLYL